MQGEIVFKWTKQEVLKHIVLNVVLKELRRTFEVI